MATRVKKVLAGIAALAALAFGGAAIASAGGGQPQQSPTPATGQSAEQQGESTAPENSATDPDNVQDTSGNDQGEPAGAEGAGETGSEVPGNDGPGGHADEPSNPNADHQAQGTE
jgi:hypothetical protein